MILPVALLAAFGVAAAWVLYEVGSLRSWVQHKHVRPRWRRVAASMGVFQIGVSATIASMNVQQGEGWGAAMSGSMATGMLGLGYLAYAALQPKWQRAAEKVA